MISKNIQQFFNENSNNLETPCVVIDINIVKEKYLYFQKNMPGIDIFYAVKSNPSENVLKALRDMGSFFDVASMEEIELCLSLNISTDKISWGNTIKKPRLIKKAYEKGIRTFATDSMEDLKAIAENAPNSNVYCRILVSNENSLWPLSDKFGCSASMAETILVTAKELNLKPIGISFHVGSQQLDLNSWSRAINTASQIFYKLLNNHSIKLELINLGGGYPAYGYNSDYKPLSNYYKVIYKSLREFFKEEDIPNLIAEPGRFIVADAGVLKTEVIMVSQKDYNIDLRWVYLDIGLYGGLPETLGESIKYNIITSKDYEKQRSAVNLAGPTCDGVDIMYKDYKYQMPVSLSSGDYLYILSTGAYTTSYSSVNFNGFKPLKEYFVE